METIKKEENKVFTPEFLAGGGEMGKRIREFDWSATSLGPVEKWPQSLRTCIRIMLNSRQPIWIGWGKELIKFYNDPYISIVGGKHPWALGKPASVVWKDIWKDIEPMLQQVMEKDEGTYVESQLLIMERSAYPEETYYTFSYTPVPGEDGRPGGMICANTDDTTRIIVERQLKTLQDLGNPTTSNKSILDIYTSAAAALEKNNKDFPFGIIYLIDKNKQVADPVAWVGLKKDQQVFPNHADLMNPEEGTYNLCRSYRTGQIVVSENKGRRKNIPCGGWTTEATHFIHIPIINAGSDTPHAIFSAALNPYRRYDDSYRQFTRLIGDQIAIEINVVLAYEQERKRAEALAELDHAKTVFFSNISHEFRTPLTLLLGPIEDALNDPQTITLNKNRLDIAYRNTLRLQKLVNSLLDFSRIEAKRMKVDLQPVKLDLFTRDIASSFRSVVEKSGLEYEVYCESLSEPVAMDEDMWEKIVLNLVSNAFKYTLHGRISVRLESQGDKLALSVSDTGIGIADKEKSRIFERFHRVENVAGKSQEGTGIGLSLVRELVKLLDGEIKLHSEQGIGSEFTVIIPWIKMPMSEEEDKRKTPTESRVASYTMEARKWFVGSDGESLPEESADSGKPKILVVDDNADMREYIFRLLSKDFKVNLASDGGEALVKSAQFQPDLIVSDIMMPRMDGFEFLQALRSRNSLRHTPFLFLSARAGEEARLEGLVSGADDYLVKPFSARELIAKIESNIRIARMRQAAERNLYNLFMQAPVGIAVMSGPSLVIDLINDTMLQYWDRNRQQAEGEPLWEVLPEVRAQGFDKISEHVMKTGESYASPETEVQILRYGNMETIYVRYAFEPRRDERGVITGLLGIAHEVTHQVVARKKIEESEQQLKFALEGAELGMYDYYFQTGKLILSDRARELFGLKPEAKVDYNIVLENVHRDDRKRTVLQLEKAMKPGNGAYENEYRTTGKPDGIIRWLRSKGKISFDEAGVPQRLTGIVYDMTKQREAEIAIKKFSSELEKIVTERTTELQRSNEDLQQFAHVASHDLKEPVRKIRIFGDRLKEEFGHLIPDGGQVFLFKIEDAAKRMSAMIDGVLKYSSLDGFEFLQEKVDLNQVMKSIENDLELNIAAKKATIEYGDLLSVRGSTILVYQMLYNLISNSLKFVRPDHSPHIEVATEKKLIVDSEDGSTCRYVQISIQDNGIGFDQAYAQDIFKTFIRLNPRDSFEGTGLGLALCKKIVERHRGLIRAEGVEGKGTSFYILLPDEE